MSNQSDVPGPGWHPDPWFSGQHRYWDGRSWTGDVFPDGPVGAYGVPQVTLRSEWERPPVAPPTTRSAVPPPPPVWGFGGATPAPTTAFAPWDLLEPPAPVQRRKLTPTQISALALAIGLVLGFVVVEQAVAASGHKKPAAAQTFPPRVPTAPASPSPSPSASAPVSNDPSAPGRQGCCA